MEKTFIGINCFIKMLTVFVTLRYTNLIAPLAELVDALDLGSSALRCVGSSPTWGKFKKLTNL